VTTGAMAVMKSSSSSSMDTGCTRNDLMVPRAGVCKFFASHQIVSCEIYGREGSFQKESKSYRKSEINWI
jgi:hypothetical protein